MSAPVGGKVKFTL